MLVTSFHDHDHLGTSPTSLVVLEVIDGHLRLLCQVGAVFGASRAAAVESKPVWKDGISVTQLFETRIQGRVTHRSKHVK